MSPKPKRRRHTKQTSRQHYVLFVYGDVEPHLHGPYSTPEARDEKAREIRRENGMEDGGIYWLSQSADGKLACGPYTGGFFDAVDNQS